MRESNEGEKLEMGQITPETGISADWCNEIVHLAWALSRAGIEEVVGKIKEHPITKYTEKYPAEMYKDKIVTEQNRAALARLDELVDRLNMMANTGTLTREDFISIYNEMQDLIRGSRARHIT